MVDRTPQEFGGIPDGVTDSTASIQAAIDAAGPSGDDVVIAGGVFRTTGQLNSPHDALRIKGDGGIRAMAGNWSAQAAILKITGTGVVVEGDGLLIDQADVIPEGDSLRGIGAVGLTIAGVTSRNSRGAFLTLGDGCTDVLVQGVDQILRLEADACVREDLATLTDGCATLDGRVMVQDGSVAKAHTRANEGVGSDDNAFAELGSGLDDRRRVNAGCHGPRAARQSTSALSTTPNINSEVETT
jgi:hypothetical protein